jgi:hypothetical protein
MSIRYNSKKSVMETDFFELNDGYLELVRLLDGGLALAKYETRTKKMTIAKWFKIEKQTFVPMEEDELTCNVRFSQSYGGFVSLGMLLQEIDSFFSLCLDLNAGHRFLLACFVLSTWIVDRLPIAPILSVVGPSQSGKTTVLNALSLLCRRSLVTSEISSAAFKRVCDRFIPTLLIDNTETTGQERRVIHLLRSGVSPGPMDPRGTQSYRTYGSKIISWTELPDDNTVNSQSIIIPMHESSRTDLKRSAAPEIVSLADKLQSNLSQYRHQNLNARQLPRIQGAENLSPRESDIYEALAIPIADEPKACVRLLECILQQREFHRVSLPPQHAAVLATLHRLIHLHPDQGTLPFSELKKSVNLNLERAGERFQVTAKAVGSALTRLGLFSGRNRISSGTVGYVDYAARKRIHDLVSRHGVDDLSGWLSSEVPTESCDICKSLDAQFSLISPPCQSTNNVPPDSEDDDPSDDAQSPSMPQMDPVNPPIHPISAAGQSPDETECIGSNRFFESEGDREFGDRILNGDYDDDDL